MKAFVFPGQGAQFQGMGKDLYESSELVRNMFQQANEILGFDITKIMFEGTEDELKQTKVTQPAVYLYSLALARVNKIQPEMVAGHSLGELSALAAAGVYSFEDGLNLVAKRSSAMQVACEQNPGSMAAIIGLDDAIVESVCKTIDELVIPANYNCPGQIVISGSSKGVDEAIPKLQEAGAKRAMKLIVGGAFHSPLMESARQQLEDAISTTQFNEPACPVYQNLDAKSSTSAKEIKGKLARQMTNPVRWTQSVENMLDDGATSFFEVGPGKVLQGLIRKVSREVEAASL
jgi:[acyl-carrier-protein] S-malonyltransferase